MEATSGLGHRPPPCNTCINWAHVRARRADRRPREGFMMPLPSAPRAPSFPLPPPLSKDRVRGPPRTAHASATGTRARVARVRAEYPGQLDYSGCWCHCCFCRGTSCYRQGRRPLRGWKRRVGKGTGRRPATPASTGPACGHAGPTAERERGSRCRCRPRPAPLLFPAHHHSPRTA